MRRALLAGAAALALWGSAAGATAAYLLTRMGGDGRGPVLVTLSSTSFRGEEERDRGEARGCDHSSSSSTWVP